MDPAQIEKWAAEAGVDTWGDGIRDDGTHSIYYEAWPEQLTRFAELVAAHERERLERQINEFPHWIGLRAKAELIAAIRKVTP